MNIGRIAQQMNRIVRNIWRVFVAVPLLGLICGCADIGNGLDAVTHPEGWQLPAIPVRQVNMNEKSPATVTNHYSFGTFSTNKTATEIACSDTKK